jgi:hypothetical protein
MFRHAEVDHLRGASLATAKRSVGGGQEGGGCIGGCITRLRGSADDADRIAIKDIHK